MDDATRDRVPPATVHLDVHIRGVVIPSWVAIALSVVAALAAGVVLMAVLMFKNAADALVISQTAHSKEIRVLGLYIQDIENVLIRNGIATREDFTALEERK
ncbi:MAG TPA: hypothetical protein VFH61_09540 [Thermoleophilia bacterium]|nr:hypothetical protein [Thermoleophilia bacterium]